MAIEVALEFRALLKLCRALVITNLSYSIAMNILETLPNKKKLCTLFQVY